MTESRGRDVHPRPARSEDVRGLTAAVDVHDRRHHRPGERGGIEGDRALQPVRGLKGDDVPRAHATADQPGGPPPPRDRGRHQRCLSRAESSNESRTADPCWRRVRRPSAAPRCGASTNPPPCSAGAPRWRSRARPMRTLPSDRRSPPPVQTHRPRSRSQSEGPPVRKREPHADLTPSRRDGAGGRGIFDDERTGAAPLMAARQNSHSFAATRSIGSSRPAQS